MHDNYEHREEDKVIIMYTEFGKKCCLQMTLILFFSGTNLKDFLVYDFRAFSL